MEATKQAGMRAGLGACVESGEHTGAVAYPAGPSAGDASLPGAVVPSAGVALGATEGTHAAAAQAGPSEEQVAELSDCVLAHPRHRELLYKALEYCIQPHDEHEVEAYLEAQPEYADALQGALVLLRTLVRHGGLVRSALDEQGRELTPEFLEAVRAERGLDRPLSEDEVADLTASHRLVTTLAGAAVVALLDPQRRIAACVEAVPERTNAFLSILQLCDERPSTLGAIKELVRDDPALEPTARTAHLRLEASYFIDRLSEAGALVWDGGWRTTPAGECYLASA